MISVKSLHKFFNKGKQNEIHVLNGVDLQLPDKGMVAIFGRSGCGKTTLLNVIGGLDRFAKGEITLDGQSIGKDTDTLRNSLIGYIFQNYNLHKGESCFDNVADALRLCGMSDAEKIEERVIAALANVGMDKYKNRTPDTLSGGQQQRIAIARAIVKNPRIILADEPTGNLDEANTVMIMDLLKAISRDHLVILVTHEAGLVDHYCDTVIELSDGKVVNVRENKNANGYAAKDKNDIYLGELEKTIAASDAAEVEYYGDTPDEPVKLKIIRKDGKTYLKIETPKVQVIDETSEIKLLEGVYQEKKEENRVSQAIDMAKLPPVKGDRFGRLFTVRSSLKSGFRANFKKGKKGKAALFLAMISFAMVLVMMTATFGTSIGALLDADGSYHHNVFYLYTPDGSISDRIHAAMDQDSGIDFLNITQNTPYYGGFYIYFHSGYFETFTTSFYNNSFRADGVLLDETLIGDAPLVAGKKDSLLDEELVITTAIADELLENSAFSYISEYSDLVGLVAQNQAINGKAMRIAGVVESKEPTYYLSVMGLTEYKKGERQTVYSLDETVGISLAGNETVLFLRDNGKFETVPKVGESVNIKGMPFTVKEVVSSCYDYPIYLEKNGIKKESMEDYFTRLVKESEPALKEGSDEFREAHLALRDEKVYEWYDYYTSEYEKFLEQYLFFEPDNYYLWLAVCKDLTSAKFNFLNIYESPYDVEAFETKEGYYAALRFKEKTGRYPTKAEAEEIVYTYDHHKDLLAEESLHYEEFYKYNGFSEPFIYRFAVSKEAYITLSKRIGDTFSLSGEQEDYKYGYYYTVIHSNDPEKTAAFLMENFSDVEAPSEWDPALITPDMLYDNIISEEIIEIIAGLITMSVVLVLLSVCMYFIMRSSLMNRIKEVGIYRAIGVSKKNLVFRFLIEALVLTTLTVFIGYLAASLFIAFAVGMSTMTASIFFYPLWLALIILAVLYGITLFCGVAPILSLLRKTPAEILAKYDI